MSTPKALPTKVAFKGEVSTRGEATALLRAPGDVVVVRRGHLRLFVISCPDGCGAIVPINLEPALGDAWKLYVTKRGLSLYPSVWRDSGCGSHFIVWDSGLFLFNDGSSGYHSVQENRELAARILSFLNQSGATSFEVLADYLDEVPWAVLDAARILVIQGQLSEIRKGVFQCRDLTPSI